MANFGTQYPGIIVHGDKLTGIDGDLITDFAKAHNLRIKSFTTTFGSTILAVKQHKADLAVSFFYNPERAHQVLYSVPYYETRSVVITNKSRVQYTGPDSLKGKRIGVIVGTVYAPIVQKNFPAGDITTLPGIPEAGKALLNGQIDALIEADTTAHAPPLQGASNIGVFPIKEGQFGITKANLTFPTSNIVACDNQALLGALDDHLKSFENSGDMTKVIKKYKQYGADPSLIPPFRSPVQHCGD